MRRRGRGQIIPGFPIYARHDSSGTVEKEPISDKWFNFNLVAATVCGLGLVFGLRACSEKDYANEQIVIAKFDHMQPAVQLEILRRRAVELYCLTGYTPETEDTDPEPVSKFFIYDNLQDFQADRAKATCQVVVDNFPFGPGK